MSSERADLNQMFMLIEGILPFEACLYYQVLPLSIEGSRLNLGMVNLNDRTAADYVRRQVSYINCSIVPSQIASDWHREILSQYLNRDSQSKQKANSPNSSSAQPPRPEKTVPAAPPNPFQDNTTEPITRPQTAQTTPQSASPPPPAVSNTDSATLVIDSPTQYTVLDEPAAYTFVSAADASTGAKPGLSRSDNAANPEEISPHTAVTAPELDPLVLDIQPRYHDQPIASLKRLLPKDLTQELLSRVIEGGIGRLFLERHETYGRILYSKDGVLQSAIDELDLQHFQGVLNELKLLTHLSLIPVHKPKQVEIERLYHKERLLLRFRVIPSNYGEEATLQVLRGAALQFYQQQQVEKLGRDALTIAQSLQVRLNEIRDHARNNLKQAPQNTETLQQLINILRQMQVDAEALVNFPKQSDDL